MSRKLATFRIVTNIFPIDGADQIEVAQVDSWKVVVRKGEVSIGSLVIYFEIDSWIPSTIAPFLTRSGNPKKYNEIEGEKLKTIKLRGQISQGLIMNISDIVKIIPDFVSKVEKIEEGVDLTDILGIMKWEHPSIEKFKSKGNFPYFIPKTDQERIQNLTKKLDDIKTVSWEVTEKYDGSSITVYYLKCGDDIKEGVCSRNIDLNMETEDGTVNTYWELAIREKLLEKLRESGLNIALQGEMVGNKIGPNIYKLENRDFWLFDIYDIDKKCYFTPAERQEFAKKYNIKHIPVIFNDYKIQESIPELLKFAEGKSTLNKKTEREGLVFKRMNPNNGSCTINSFKAISNNYLMKIES